MWTYTANIPGRPQKDRPNQWPDLTPPASVRSRRSHGPVCHRRAHPALRRTLSAELNKGEARNSRPRAVAFHRLGRSRDRGLENQQTRAAALNFVTAAIILFNCRYLDRAVEETRHQGTPIDPAILSRLSPLGWNRIDLIGDNVWSDRLDLDANGFMPLLIKRLP